jgi:pilus assembly protein FimV
MGTAQAARLGHARVDSVPGAPLQVVVPLLDLTPDELANLQVSLADASVWQQAGLQPPTPLAETRATLETDAKGNRVVRVSSTQAATTDAIDVLLELQSSAGQRQLQLTVLVQPGNAAAGVQRAAADAAAKGSSASSDRASAGQVKVRPGQTLWGIAASHAVPNTTIYQELVALWQANPHAFSQNNMDLVHAGATLTLPDAATVQAIDPTEARRIFAEHVDAYHRYLAGRGARGAAPVAQGRSGASGKVGSGPAGQGGSGASAQDQLRLSAGADAKADESTSAQHAMQDASKRVDELKSNVEVLNQAASAAGAAIAAGAGAGDGTNGQQQGANASQTAPGNPGAAGNGTTEGAPVTGPNSPAAAALGAAKQAVAKTGMPNWLSENLLSIITVVLAIVIFIVAWVLRRAGQRRSEDDETDGFAEPTIDGRVIDEKLSHINLELDKPPTNPSSNGGRA